MAKNKYILYQRRVEQVHTSGRF